MTVRSARRLLSALGTAALGVLPLVMAWGLWWPLPVALPVPATKPAKEQVHAGASESVPGLPGSEMWDAVCTRELRRPLFDPPPPPPKVVEAKPPPPLKAKLLGTIIEPGNSRAMLRTARGSVELRRVGERIAGEEPPVEVIEIQQDLVVVRREAETITLKIERK